jgi:hypothetical protein
MSTSLLRAFAIALVILPAACAGKAATSERAGVLTVGVSTTGSGAGGLSFFVEVRSARADAEAPRTDRVKADGGVATFHDLPDGSYDVRLTLPAHCAASNGESRQITIAPRRTTAVRFAVACR